MTLPRERTRSVVNAREFLARLVSPYVPNGYKRIPKPVREEALRLLRHFPSVVDMKYASESFCPQEADRIMDERE
jgi:hypothetical protein